MDYKWWSEGHAAMRFCRVGLLTRVWKHPTFMGISSKRRFLFGLWLSILLGFTAPTLRAQEKVFELDPANSKIQFTLDATLHSVHGTFKLKSGTIHFNPATGAASGQLVVDATSGDTENDGRDRRMHKVVLESASIRRSRLRPPGSAARSLPTAIPQ